MLQPSAVVNAIIEAIVSIPSYVAQMGGASNITGHFFLSGEENSLTKAVSTMTGPSTLVAWTEQSTGNFSGAELFAHVIKIYIKGANSSNPTPGGPSILSIPDLWWILLTQPLLGTADTFLTVRLLNNSLLMAGNRLPSIRHYTDEIGDFFEGTLVFLEQGDVGVYPD